MKDGKAQDIVVLDQRQGCTVPCDWVEFGQVQIAKGQHVAACRYVGSEIYEVSTPEGWQYEDSLTTNHTYMPDDKMDEQLLFLRTERNTDFYLSATTGEVVGIGRTK